MRSRNMPPSPLTGRTHIDDLQRRSPLIQLVDAHLSDSFQQKSRRVPRFHPADQIPGEFRVSGPNKQTHDSFQVVVMFQHEKNWLFWIEHPARPNRKNGCAADVERAGDVTAAKCEHVAHINEDASLFLDGVFEHLGWKTGNAWKVPEHFRALSVHFLHDWIVMWDWWGGFDCIVGETFRVSELQEFVKLPLVPNRAAQACTDIRPTR